MVSLLLRNLFFTVLQPGVVAGLIPFLIVGNPSGTKFTEGWTLLDYLGTVVFSIGFIIMIVCIISFAVKGKGTLSPADPTKHLVITGLYKFSRNPMYVGVTMMLGGEALFYQSPALWVYSLFIFAAFNIFILLHEEPRLRNDFGNEYVLYCKKVRRWM